MRKLLIAMTVAAVALGPTVPASAAPADTCGVHQQVDDNGNSWWVATNCDPNGWGQDYQWNQDGQVHGTCIADQRTGLCPSIGGRPLPLAGVPDTLLLSLHVPHLEINTSLAAPPRPVFDVGVADSRSRVCGPAR